MSFDIFLQAFEGGEEASRDGDPVRRLLLGDARAGGTDVYGVPEEGAPLTGLMFNHTGGEAAFDLIVDAARAAGLVIMPVGCAVCLVDASQRAHLPPELAEEGVEVVTSGRELMDVIERA